MSDSERLKRLREISAEVDEKQEDLKIVTKRIEELEEQISVQDDILDFLKERVEEADTEQLLQNSFTTLLNVFERQIYISQDMDRSLVLLLVRQAAVLKRLDNITDEGLRLCEVNRNIKQSK